MQNTVNEVVAGELRAILARRGINGSALANRVGETPMWVSRRLRGTVPLTVADLARICEALGIDPREVVGVLDQPPAAASS